MDAHVEKNLLEFAIFLYIMKYNLAFFKKYEIKWLTLFSDSFILIAVSNVARFEFPL
jgi:hypothetical protein